MDSLFIAALLYSALSSIFLFAPPWQALLESHFSCEHPLLTCIPLGLSMSDTGHSSIVPIPKSLSHQAFW